MNGREPVEVKISFLILAAFVAAVIAIYAGTNKGAARIQVARMACIEQGGQWIDFNASSRICIRGDHKIGETE